MSGAASLSFWKATLVLFKARRSLALSLAAMITSAIGFGTGLGLFLPVFQLLLGSSPAQLVRQYLQHPGMPDIFRSSAHVVLRAFPTDPFWAFNVLMAVICIAAVVSSLAAYADEILSARVVRCAAHSWRTRVFRHTLHLPLSDSVRLGSSECLSRLIADTEVLAQGYAALVGKTSCDLLQAMAALVVAFALDWRLALLCLAGAIPTGLLMSRLGHSIRAATTRLLVENAGMLGTLQEALRAIPVIKVHQAEREVQERFRAASRRHLRCDLRSRRVKALGSPAVEVITVFGVATIACIAAWFVFRRSVEAPSVLALLLALSGASQSLRTVGKVAHKIQEADVAATRLFAVLEMPQENYGRKLLRAEPVTSLPPHSGYIEFQGVTFSYPDRPAPAVENVNLRIDYGQIVALVGENGAGKSTLLNLLPRLFEPERGRILIDGRDISTVGLSSLRRQIGMVPQQSVLFNGTIVQNLLFGTKASRKRLIATARAACVDEFIKPLPKGYLTLLGELGSGLSEGQKQRLAIARALLRKPRILLLDEPTSQIDPDSESKINQVLRGLAGRATVIVIAHRSSTIRLADVVVRMDKGRIVGMTQPTALRVLQR
ncbi:MAG: ABC transporter ATP-binding protein [Acidobacteria bacterium]|nr:MAG: ABC transporter ATP-binding protein [Acidobacteriota bacterium]